MVRPAQTLTAGTLAATALFALAATDASAQSRQEVLNQQLQLGDVLSGQVLNVEGARDAVSVDNAATGNSLYGATVGAPARLVSDQDMQGDARATTELNLTGDTTAQVRAATQAVGNALTVGVEDARLDIAARQSVGAGEIVANTYLPGGSAQLRGETYVTSSAQGNAVLIGGDQASINGTIAQASDASVRAGTLAEMRYVPARTAFESQAIANTVAINTPSVSNQVLATRQTSTGDLVEAETSANAANAWDMTSRAVAASNRAVFQNGGGSVVLATEQDNGSTVRARAINTAYDFGAVMSDATGVGNQVEVGNNDIYLEIDNTQLNSGGVDVEASFEGYNGYDAYVSATAAGNSVTGYACSTCPAEVVVTNSQVNTGDVSAIARTNIGGSGRAIVTQSQAVGNSASFYVTRPGG